MSKDSIINCHTHIFTANHVPPFIAKTYVPTPFHIFISLRPIVSFFRFWYKYPAKVPYSIWYKKFVKAKTWLIAFFGKLFPLNVIASYYIFIWAFFLMYDLLRNIFPEVENAAFVYIDKVYNILSPFLPIINSTFWKTVIVFVVFIFFETIRNVLLFIAGLIWKMVKAMPGKQTKEMFKRYLNIGRFAFHKEQKTILSKLKSQYPNGTGFVILPMDMDYMEAGYSRTRYRDQMQELAAIKNMPSNKNALHPFIFADPRRMVKPEDEHRHKPGDKEYFNWIMEENKITLGDCFIKDYLEVNRFSGIKIYPALGYYPFDEKLLPLWKYAADNNIPIMTHCIKGTIFYRGRKKDLWNKHPVFKQAMAPGREDNGDGFADDEEQESSTPETNFEPLVLPETKNVDFSYNFTNPMNYLCILEEELLRGLVKDAMITEPRLEQLFGYNGPDKPLTYDLKNLKICLGHYGGDEEWTRYFEKDRYSYSSQLAKHPDTGIRFFKTVTKENSPGKPEQLWKFTDWYSIISSMMLQYPKIYADISYILHSDQAIFPLLKQTLLNPKLREKVLYGTDFFVVRNHKSDKNLLADMMGGLSEEDFDKIARANPRKYLENDFSSIQ